MFVRIRQPEDIGTCVELLAEVHAANGYPLHWPDDPLSWLAPDNILAAWVAEHESALIGHIALCSGSGESGAGVWSAACDIPPDGLAAIAKLFVAPSSRGRGIGAALLDRACAEARARSLFPVLEVLDHDQGAIALY